MNSIGLTTFLMLSRHFDLRLFEHSRSTSTLTPQSGLSVGPPKSVWIAIEMWYHYEDSIHLGLDTSYVTSMECVCVLLFSGSSTAKGHSRPVVWKCNRNRWWIFDLNWFRASVSHFELFLSYLVYCLLHYCILVFLQQEVMSDDGDEIAEEEEETNAIGVKALTVFTILLRITN